PFRDVLQHRNQDPGLAIKGIDARDVKTPPKLDAILPDVPLLECIAPDQSGTQLLKERRLVVRVRSMAELGTAHADQLLRRVPKRRAEGRIHEQRRAVKILERDPQGRLFDDMAESAVMVFLRLPRELSIKRRNDHVAERLELVDECCRPLTF